MPPNSVIFVSLPTELIFEILLVAAWSDRSSLFSCSLVSKAIHLIAEPIVYYSIAIISEEHLAYYASLAREVKSDSPLRHVRHLWLGAKPGELSNLRRESRGTSSLDDPEQWHRREMIHKGLA